MVTWHIDNDFTKRVRSQKRFEGLSELEHKRVYSEVRNVVLQGIEDSFGGEVDTSVDSLLHYVLGFRDDKPTKPQKISSEGSYADFDIDFSKELRGEVKTYLKGKFGEDRVSDVVTFNTLAARAAVRSAQRALGHAISHGADIAKHIPEIPGIKLEEALEASKQLREAINKCDETKEIWAIARKLEGLPQALGVHACAFVIADKPTTEYVPSMISTKKDGGDVLTQFEYYDVEAQGVLKMDLLGLKTLDVIKGTCDLVKDMHGVDIDIENIDVNDAGIYKVLNAGYNCGIFQFESDLFQGAVRQVVPTTIDELSDITSLLRPGPMSMGMLDQYVDAKFNGNKYEYKLRDQKLIEKVWDICKSSYGLMVYQEQVIKCFSEIGGFNEIEGDNARRAMGKKKEDVMKALKQEWIKGGMRKGYDEKDLAELFTQIEGFSGYGFNKSHAICYSYISARTAYLSHYYPLEFYTTLLTIDSGNTDDVRRYIAAVKKRGFKVLAPDINRSSTDFTIDGDDIIFGVSGVKGVGKAVSNKILRRRPKKGGYKGLGHFVMRNLDCLNKKILEQYAKAGLFGSFGVNKASALQSVRDVLDFMDKQKAVDEYETIFEMVKDIDLARYVDTCKIKNINVPDELIYEIETLGFYITKHPLEDMVIDTKKAHEVKDVLKMYHDQKFLVVGAICSIDVRKTKSKTNMATFDLTSVSESMRCTVFPRAYADNMDMLEEGAVVVVSGIIKQEDDSNTFIVNNIYPEFDRYVIERVAKTDDYVAWIDAGGPVDPGLKECGVVINSQLSYILEK